MSVYKAEYIWVDGTKPTPQLRSKTKVIELGHRPEVWGFDGSSTNQAEGENSDCVLNPVFLCDDPIRKGFNKLVMCEVLNTDMSPHESNTRAKLRETHNEHVAQDMWFGLEQEYTFVDGVNGLPYGFNNCARTRNDEQEYSFDPVPQGPYYCSVGSGLAVGRGIVEEHLNACINANIKISGVNAEVMPGQWEYQVGPLGPLDASDQLWIARWLLDRIAENHGVAVSLDPKPAEGDWNGAGCHTNFSTRAMRSDGGIQHCEKAAEALGERAHLHIKNYGADIEKRLTGDHETCSHEEFRYGVSDRGASVRIPWQVAKDGKGYIEDRRPNANCDPYVVTQLITETVCGS